MAPAPSIDGGRCAKRYCRLAVKGVSGSGVVVGRECFLVIGKVNPMNEPMKNRREFLATVGAAGAASMLAGSVGARRGPCRRRQGEARHRRRHAGAQERARFRALWAPVLRRRREEGAARGPRVEVAFPLAGRGSKVLQFEKAYAAHIGVKYAIGVTSGTTALYTAMAALEIGPGDEVILPAWTWYADYDAVVLCGALPVFVEIDESLAMDPKEIEAKITPRTKAIVPSHLQGGVADMDAILEIARKHKLRVVEDCAQCCGGRYKGKYVGSIGDMGINSFQLSKTITAGEGGAVTTNDPELFERAFRFHDVGTVRSPYNEDLERRRAGGASPRATSA